MGGYLSREWSEVHTGSSPGSPNDPPVAEKTANLDSGEIARRRILRVDPRSISDDVTRTPIQVDRNPGSETSTPRAAAPPFLDPRSPSHDMPRTPIAKNPSKNKLNLDDSLQIESKYSEEPVPPPPVRGAAVIPELKELEKKIVEMKVGDQDDDYKEEGEITHDSDEETDEMKPCKETTEIEKEPEPLKLMPRSKLQNIPLERIVREETGEKEDGEITHDSDDENERLQKTPPPTIRSKSTLEADCRSPLLIENDGPVFEKALTNELAAMAARNTPRQRKPLGEVNNDSLVI